MGMVVEVPIKLPHPSLPEADWADAFQASFDQKYQRAREAAEVGFSGFPPFVTALLKLRNIVVRPFGLDTGDPDKSKGDRIGFFPVISDTDSELIVGMDDKHLDFRIVLDLTDKEGLQEICLATIIKRHNWLGKSYLFLIMPFHKMIVKNMMKRVANK